MHRAAPLPLLVISLTAAALLAATPVGAYTLEAKPSPSVGFRVYGPARFPIDGRTAAVSLKHDGDRVTVDVDLRKLSTGLGFRDDHMRGALDTRRYPTARLVVAADTLVAVEASHEPRTVPAELTLHGVTRAVPVQLRAVCAAQAGAPCQVTGGIDLDMRQFGVVVAPLMGMTIDPGVHIEVALTIGRSR